MNPAHAQQPSIVPGQVQTRFLEGTPQREVVAQVSQTTPLDLGGLDNVTEELSQRLGVPLRIQHLGSGYWLTFAVDRMLLASKIHSILESHDEVHTVTVTASSDSIHKYVVSATDGSTLDRAIARKNERAVDQLLDTWNELVGLPLQYVFDDDHLSLAVDWDAGTLNLVERFKSVAEIEAAQPNYRMGINSSQASAQCYDWP